MKNLTVKILIFALSLVFMFCGCSKKDTTDTRSFAIWAAEDIVKNELNFEFGNKFCGDDEYEIVIEGNSEKVTDGDTYIVRGRIETKNGGKRNFTAFFTADRVGDNLGYRDGNCIIY